MIMNVYVTKAIILLIMSLMSGLLVYILLSRDTNYILERLKKGRAIAQKRGFWDDLLEVIKPFTEANLNYKNGYERNKTKRMLIRLGMSATDADVMNFENKRTLHFILAGVCGFVFFLFLIPSINNSVYNVILVGFISITLPSTVAYKMPAWKLIKKIKRKEKAFEKFFADAIDLLCVCVEAGLSIDSAIERVGREFTNFSKEVGSEFNRIAKDILSGVSKQDALKGLAERVENKDIQSFVAIIIQADKMGASISSSLSVCADSLRTKRKQRLEALVSAASTKMTIPLVLCLLPATFAVILAPAIIQVIENLGKLNAFSP